MYRILFLFCVGLTFCQSSSKKETLQLIQKIQLEIPETSGLTYANGFLYTVSDAKNAVYKISLDGVLLEKYKADVKDLEGIAFNEDTGLFYLVSEAKRKLFEFDVVKGILGSEKVKGAQNGGANKGLEGVTYNTKDQRLYLVNEAKPKKLLRLSSKNKKIKEAFDLEFGKDISGICYDKKRDVFWVLSDESQIVYKTTDKGVLLKEYLIPVVKAEGVAINLTLDRLYIVNDGASELFVFQLKE